MARARFSQLGGLPLLYDRNPALNYGITGIPFSPWIDTTFARQADAAFHQIVSSLSGVGLGEATAILSGGVGRSGNGPSLHHQNRAFDLDGLTFEEGQNWVADTFPSRPLIYIGIEAILRQHFGTVLSYQYNAAHRDHFHFDNGRAVGFRRDARSHTLFLQNSFKYLFDEMLGIDGVYGPETASVERRVRAELGVGGLSNRANWLDYLGTCVELALNREAEMKRLNTGAVA
ncbi:MAG: extensin family protein [Pseudomonadota bacterium]